MVKSKVAVLVSGGGTNLQALIDAEKSGIITSGTISLVVSNKQGAYAMERAENAGIEAVYIPRGGEFEAKLTELLDKKGIVYSFLSIFAFIKCS